MYSPEIVERNLWRLRKKERIERRSVSQSQAIALDLQRRYLRGIEAGEKPGTWPRMTEEESAFVRSEILLCRYDFRYFADRYGYREIEGGQGGGHGVTAFWPSQERALELIAKREEECYEEIQRSGMTQGVLGVWNKTRQQGATALLRLITGHRICTRKHMRCIAASLDDKRVDELYKRDHIWLDNLPFFLAPAVKFEEKSQHITFDNDAGSGMKSSILYQMSSQKAGVGVGQQFDMAHFTELSKWEDAWRIEGDFMPTIAKAVTTFVGWESTPWGRGEGNFWYVFTEAVRKKEEGYESWIYVFTPHYINERLNRLPAPDSWTPKRETMAHADIVEKTSPEWTGGRTHRMTRDQMYWWESKFKAAQKQNQLHVFFTDYPATPEQGFQHHESSAFPVETLDWMRSCTGNGIPYHVHVEAAYALDTGEPIPVLASEQDRAPALFNVGRIGKLMRMAKEELDHDPRGIFWIWELPRRSASYIMGMDITFGRTGWNRYARTKSDGRTDNGTIEIVRVGRGLAKTCGCPACRNLSANDPQRPMPDHLVAEYAAPVDPEDLAYIANIAGRVYAGTEEDQCKCIMEVHPGPGKLTMKKMLELGYRNQWLWVRYADMVNNQTPYPGWNASNQSNRDLWVLSSRHINLHNFVPFSPFFVEECADAIFNSVKCYAENVSGHDDRLRAGSLALWAANSWQMMGDRTQEQVSTHQQALDPQRSDMTLEEISDYYQSTWDRLMESM